MSCLCTPATHAHLPMAIDSKPHHSRFKSQAPCGVHPAVHYWHFGGIYYHIVLFLSFFLFLYSFFFTFSNLFFSFFSRIFFSFFLPPSNLTLELALRLSQMPKFDFKDLTIVDQPASNAIVQSMHQKVKKRNAQIIIENRNLFSSRT